jgi:hypothetical protein
MRCNYLRDVGAGLVGLGKIGRDILQSSSDHRSIRFHWIVNKEYAIVKEHPGGFSPNDLKFILRPGMNSRTADFGRLCEKQIPDCRCYPLGSPADEADILRSLVRKPLEWIVFDATSSKQETDYEIASAAIGCLGFCTANKTPWADHRMCAELYKEAREAETCLGLNCTTGVWVDQMDIIPIVMLGFQRGRIAITKRDNSSLNTFVSKVGSGKSAETALREITKAGLLEPGAEGLSAEVHDQTLKARIATNICALLRGVESRFLDRTSALGAGLRSNGSRDIAEWHKAGREKGVYRALVSEIILDREIDESLQCEVYFKELQKGDPLAKDFVRKNAIFIESSSGTAFGWRKETGPSDKRGFMHDGYADAAEAASKLLWEAEEILRMSRSKGRKAFSPLPILLGLSRGEESATKLREEIATRL